MRQVVSFHLLNDFSGSPKVLKAVLDGFCQQGYSVDLITSNTHGVLDSLSEHPTLKIRTYSYHFRKKAITTTLNFIWAQLCLFFMSFSYIRNKQAVFYINTILPVGAAIAGWIMRKKIIYHYHENAFAKGRFYMFLYWIMIHVATKIICVSDYQKKHVKRTNNVFVIPNAIDSTFSKCFTFTPDANFEMKNILMVSSLKAYKGIAEFFSLANHLPQYKFTLVLNDTQEGINRFISSFNLAKSDNLSFYSRQENVVSFYQNATLTLNLSDKNKFLETFGLTVLESFSAGLPVIVPTEGGIADLVEDGINGYKIDIEHLALIESKIIEILTDKTLYEHLAKNAYTESKKYSESIFIKKISAVFL